MRISNGHFIFRQTKMGKEVCNMTGTRRKEDLSVAYLSAIAAQASVDFEICRHDEDSVDCMLKKEVLLDDERQFRASLHVQLKSTSSISQYSISENAITYQLKKKNYDDLRKRGTSEIILCLLVLPEEAEKPWVCCTDDELLLHGRMYWCSLRDKPDAVQKEKVPVELPQNQFLDPDMLNTLMLQIAGGDLL